MRDMVIKILFLTTAILAGSTFASASEVDPTCHQAKQQLTDIAIKLFAGEAPDNSKLTEFRQQFEEIESKELCSDRERAQMEAFLRDLKLV